jgi:3-hydroxybutyryl-CoA dehydrogenase
MVVGVLGAGTMGAGIAQVAAQNGSEVVLVDLNQEMLTKAETNLDKVLARLVEKNSISEDEKINIQGRITYSTDIHDFKASKIVIEAIVEKLEVKHSVFPNLEAIVSQDCILASNTSSLSIASIGSVLKNPSRIIGIHFFNPAPLMPLVEIIPAVQTSEATLSFSKELISNWKKVGVICKDTPGFIVNRVARPFYGEALRIYEEGIADFATIDWAMTSIGGFKMGPFTLMDYIGNDINYAVTESVFEAFYYDPRFKPSFTQKRHKEAGFYGRKSGRGYYNYAEGTEIIAPNQD